MFLLIHCSYNTTVTPLFIFYFFYILVQKSEMVSTGSKALLLDIKFTSYVVIYHLRCQVMHLVIIIT